MSVITQNLSRNRYFNWAVKNLFSSWVNTIMTIIAAIFVYEIGSFFLNWSIFSADFRTNFQGEIITDRTLCSKNIVPGEYGACWAIIYARWDQFMYGLYPVEETWRVNLTYALLPFLSDESLHTLGEFVFNIILQRVDLNTKQEKKKKNIE